MSLFAALAVLGLATRMERTWTLLTSEWLGVFFPPVDAAVVDASRDAGQE